MRSGKKHAHHKSETDKNPEKTVRAHNNTAEQVKTQLKIYILGRSFCNVEMQISV